MSLIDVYQSSKLGITENHGKEPTPRQPTFGFYSQAAGQSIEAINNADSRLHNEYSTMFDPSDLDVSAYNPLAWWGFPYDSTLDALDPFSPKNLNGMNYNTQQRYRDLGPSEGRY